MKYKTYEKYKDSGIEWIGESPIDWLNTKLKILVGYVKGYAFKIELFRESGIPVVKASDIKNFTIREGKDFLSIKDSKMFSKVELNENDIIVSTVGSSPEVIESAVGQIAKVPKELNGSFLNQNTVKYFSKKNNKLNNDFLFYIFRSNSYRKYLDLHSHGTANQASLNIKDMLDFYVPIPKIEEQKIIAEYLDNKTSLIEQIISKKQKQIELLKEKRASLINHAVTKGLDPNVKMKDSGIEWIGEIPEHWEVKKLKYVSYINMGQSPDSNSVNDIENGIPFFQGKTEFGSLYPNVKKWCNNPTKIARINDILICVRAPVGDLNISNSICCIGRGLASIKSKNYKYMYYLLFSSSKELNSFATGSTFESISLNQLKNLYLPYVSNTQEQKIIAEYLDNKTSKIDNLIQKIEKQIELLKEKKTVLISNAVTGKIDVRKEIA